MSVASRLVAPALTLADVAARHCAEGRHPEPRFGGNACDACWERAVRDDERLAREYGLPEELISDPEYVDDIAVELACRGERVPMTPIEQAAAAHRLRSLGLSPVEIARRLHMRYINVVELLSGGPKPLSDVPHTSDPGLLPTDVALEEAG